MHTRTHSRPYTYAHTSIQGRSLSSVCEPLHSLPLFLFVSAGSGTPVQACTGTQQMDCQSVSGPRLSCTGLRSHARRPGIKPDSSGSAPLVQVMLHSADLYCTASKWARPAHVSLVYRQWYSNVQKQNLHTHTRSHTHTHTHTHTHSFPHYTAL